MQNWEIKKTSKCETKEKTNSKLELNTSEVERKNRKENWKGQINKMFARERIKREERNKTELTERESLDRISVDRKHDFVFILKKFFAGIDL